MGYTTKFTGELLFTTTLNPIQLKKVESFFGEDCRDHKEWGGSGTYIDLVFNKDFTGLKWDSSTEKNNGMVSHVNVIIREMQKIMPEFGLTGYLSAQGESFNDKWLCKIENGIAIEKSIEIKGQEVSCPHCGENFIIDTES